MMRENDIDAVKSTEVSQTGRIRAGQSDTLMVLRRRPPSTL